MTIRPNDTSAFEFATLAALRTKQLMRGCVRRVSGSSKLTTVAQREIAAGLVSRALATPDPEPARGPLAGE
jgi:DNA-directed RNA polymerase subunit K/omega